MRVCLFVLCCVVLGYGMFRPESPPDLFEESDKVLHVLAFGALALSSRLAFTRLSGVWIWPPLVLLAPVLEYLQHAVQPGRQFSVWDISANVLGVILARLGWQVLNRLRRRLAAAL